MKKVTMLAMVASLALGCTVGGEEGEGGLLLEEDGANDLVAELSNGETGTIRFEAHRLGDGSIDSNLYIDGALWTSHQGVVPEDRTDLLVAIADDVRTRGVEISEPAYARFNTLVNALNDELGDVTSNPLAELALAHGQAVDGVVALDSMSLVDESENHLYSIGTTRVTSWTNYKQLEAWGVRTSCGDYAGNICVFLDALDPSNYLVEKRAWVTDGCSRYRSTKISTVRCIYRNR